MSEEKEPRQFLPCIENPPRCYLTSTAHDRRLSNNKDGRVVSSNRRSNQETFVIIPQGNDLVMIQSFKHHGYLRCGGGAIDDYRRRLGVGGSCRARQYSFRDSSTRRMPVSGVLNRQIRVSTSCAWMIIRIFLVMWRETLL